MSRVTVTEDLMESCIQDMPYEILFEIFGWLSKAKLQEISKLCPNFRDVSGDPRFWKNVHIKYKPNEQSTNDIFDLEELYSGPWPVEVVNLSGTKINPPVSFHTDQVVKVTKLDLTSIKANRYTIEALLAKYQCTELYLDFNNIVCRLQHGQSIMEIEPEAFPKLTALEVLVLGGIRFHYVEDGLWLAQILRNCKYLKTLDLNYTSFNSLELMSLGRSLPTSLEKLFIAGTFPENSFFKSLAEITPNLRELKLNLPSVEVELSSLLKFQFLEVLHVVPYYAGRTEFFHVRLYGYLIKFPALKTVCLNRMIQCTERVHEKFRTTLESHGIVFERTEERKWSDRLGHTDGKLLWKVSKTM